MHQKQFSRRRHGRPSFNVKGGARRTYTHTHTRRAPGGRHIDHQKFINKAITLGAAVPFVPVHRFEDFAVADAIKRNVSAKGYTTPTPIQDQTIPYILAGQDVVGIANTGTGKTAAFLIPLINKVLKNSKEQVLIIVPTRELALQIDGELKAFTKGMQLFSVCAVGGISIGPQLKALRYKNSFVIGTPGRLKDLIERKSINLAHFSTLVLDEADRMLDMGFIADMRFIMAGMPTPRHTLFFSATLSPEVERLIADFLHEPVRIRIAARQASEHIDQDIVRIPHGGDKLAVLRGLLDQPGFDKVLVFGRTKHGVERLAVKLSQQGVAAESIHGNKTQNNRQKALTLFKQDQVKVLVATDVAARGLDISGVSHVINYDLPASHDDYVHRIGRTGRAGRPGKALTFVE